MRESDKIIDQLCRSVHGGAWHGPALVELLKDLTSSQAVSRPIPEAHTIWEIVLHVTVWMNQISARLVGEGRRDLPPEEDWPAMPLKVDERSWRSTLDTLESAYDALAARIRQVDEARLDEPIMEGFSTVYVSLHGIVQHNLYHAGQIALLKKST